MDTRIVVEVPPQVARDAEAVLQAGAVDTVSGEAKGTRTEERAGRRPAERYPLSGDQQAILDFERAWWRRGGAKEQAIRDTFGLSPTRYYQSLNGLLDLPAALVYDAPLVHRLRRVRADAVRARRALD
jgi:hypothetical protein